jgi:site-specific DNA-methyltransferase (adenine-specific)
VAKTISVFYSSLPQYNPQGIVRCERKISNSTKTKKHNNITAINGGAFKTSHYMQEFTNYPRQVLKYSVEQGIHKTQKPIALMEYLIKTYTDEGELVLDFTMGSGTTGVACKNLGRDFIGIEMDDGYFEIAKKRIEDKG